MGNLQHLVLKAYHTHPLLSNIDELVKRKCEVPGGYRE